MTTLLELLFVLLVGGDPQTLPRIPGATHYEILPSRQALHEDAPAFTGIVHLAAGEQQLQADCAWFPYWDGQTRYPCWPQRISIDATAVPSGQDLTVWLDGDDDGEVVLTIRVYGTTERVWLPEVAR